MFSAGALSTKIVAILLGIVAAGSGWYVYEHVRAQGVEPMPIVVSAQSISLPATTSPANIQVASVHTSPAQTKPASPVHTTPAKPVIPQSPVVETPAPVIPSAPVYIPTYGSGSGIGFSFPNVSTVSNSGNQNTNNNTDNTPPPAPATPTIILGSVTKNFGDASFALSATTNSNGTVSYAITDASVATVSGNTVTVIGAGTTVITASVSATATYIASSTTATLTVSAIDPTLSFAPITKIFGDANFALAPTSNSAGTFSFSSGNTSVATVSGATVTIVATGTSVITVTQTSTTNYHASSTTTVLTVNPGPPTLGSFPNITKQLGDSPFTLTDPTSNSAGAFSYVIDNPLIASVSGHTVTLGGMAGQATVAATQAARGNYTSSTTSMILTVTNGYCENHPGVCNSGMCQNGPDDTFSCTCTDPSTGGALCDQCSDLYNTCKNGSTCFPDGGAAYCICDENFCGESCAQLADNIGGTCPGGGVQFATPPLNEARRDTSGLLAAIFNWFGSFRTSGTAGQCSSID